MRVTAWSDWLEYQRLGYFRIRFLITDPAEWTTAQIQIAKCWRVRFAPFRDGLALETSRRSGGSDIYAYP